MAVSSGSLPAIPMNERKYTIVSVIRSQRNLSSYEYENSTANLYNFSRRYTERIPKRRRRWLAYNIESAMNRLYLDAQRITEYYNKDSNAVHEYKRTAAKSCMLKLYNELYDGYRMTKKYEHIKGGKNGELLQADKWQHLRWGCYGA